MVLTTTTVAGVLLAASSLPAFILALWVSRQMPTRNVARLSRQQRHAISVHMLLVGSCLLAAGVALYWSDATVRMAIGTSIAVLVVVNALGISLWLRLHALRKRGSLRP